MIREHKNYIFASGHSWKMSMALADRLYPKEIQPSCALLKQTALLWQHIRPTFYHPVHGIVAHE